MNGGNAMNARIALNLAAAISLSLTMLAGCAASTPAALAPHPMVTFAVPERATQPEGAAHAEMLAVVNEQRVQGSLLREGQRRWAWDDDSPLAPSHALASPAPSADGVGSRRWTKPLAYGPNRR
jgi:hypothetical protein